MSNLKKAYFMKILVVDGDDVSANLLQSKIESLGHTLVHETNKAKVVELVKQDFFDVIFIDPAPLNSAKNLIIDIRRSSQTYSYVFLMSASASLEDALLEGANDVLAKPLQPQGLDEKLMNAMNLKQLLATYGDDSFDFPSAGGVIAKSAFNQLFLSSMDRSDRYGEKTYVLKISIDNFEEILTSDGPYALDFAGAKLSQNLVYIRRQSDIIGQTGKYEYSLLLLRPVYEQEPLEAANRFADTIQQIEDMAAPGASEVIIRVALFEVPTGQIIVAHDVSLTN